MADTPYQPILPPEDQWSDAERTFIEESPPEFFPDNQDSNVGLLRRIFSEQSQEEITQLEIIFFERFVQSAVTFLDEWEKQMGLPVAPGGLATVDRRARLLSRVRKGRFTRTQRRQVVEEFIQATFGAVPTFGPEGITIGTGIVLHSEPADVAGLYDITEDIPNFTYTVTIAGSVTVDTAGLTRELQRLTPAHINFSLVSGTVPGAAVKVSFDTGLGTDTGVSTISIRGFDSAIGVDNASPLFKGVLDTAAGLESGSISSALPRGTEVGSGGDTSFLLGKPIGSEIGSGSDSGIGGVAVQNYGSGLFSSGTFGGIVGAPNVQRRDIVSSDSGAASATVAVTPPTVQAGDMVLIVIAIADNTGTITLAPPSGVGMTLKGSRISSAGNGQTIYVYEKQIAIGEVIPSVYTFTIGGGTSVNYQWLAEAASYYDSDTNQALHISNLTLADATLTGGQLTSPTITPGMQNSRVVSTFVVDEPTFGKGSIGAVNTGTTFGGELKAGSKFTLAKTRTVSQLLAYMNLVTPASGTETENWRAVIYDTSGNLVAYSSDITLTGSSSTGWKLFTFTTPVSLTAGDYWLMLQAGPIVPSTGALLWGISWDTTGGTSYIVNSDAYADGPSAVIGTTSGGVATRNPSYVMLTPITMTPVSPAGLVNVDKRTNSETTLSLNYLEEYFTAASGTTTHTVASDGTVSGVVAIASITV